MEISWILDILKVAPEGLSFGLVLVALLVSYFLKKSDVDLTQVTSISKLQTDQLAILIEQNTLLSKELHAVRNELSEAYKIIKDMGERISDLEHSLKNDYIPKERN